MRLAIVCLAVLGASAVPAVAQVQLRFGAEKVPPGGLAQAKLFVTEPKPISTAAADFNLDGFSDIVGIALISSARDTLGVAIVTGSRVTLSILSPSATFGMTLDYPVLTVAGHVAATAPVGATFTLGMDAAAFRFTDPSGAVYPALFSPGSLLVAPNVGVDDVIPGSASVAAGDVITVVGRGFVPRTNVKLKEVVLSDVSYVDETHMRVTVAQAARMHGAGVLVTNPGGAQTKYFSYQRTVRQATSLQVTLREAVPIFADTEVTTATLAVEGHFTGLAIQNRQEFSVFAVAELMDASGRELAATIVQIRPHHFLLNELSELFGIAYSPSQAVRVRSLAPIQVMGVAVDAGGNATPLFAR